MRLAMFDDRRETGPNGSLPVEVFDHLGHGLRHRLWRGRLWRPKPEALGEQGARRRVHRGALDSRAPNIDSQCLHQIAAPSSGIVRSGSIQALLVRPKAFTLCLFGIDKLQPQG